MAELNGLQGVSTLGGQTQRGGLTPEGGQIVSDISKSLLGTSPFMEQLEQSVSQTVADFTGYSGSKRFMDEAMSFNLNTATPLEILSYLGRQGLNLGETAMAGADLAAVTPMATRALDKGVDTALRMNKGLFQTPTMQEGMVGGREAVGFSEAPNKFSALWDKKPRFEIDDSMLEIKPVMQTLKTGSLEGKTINSVTYKKNKDGTFDLMLVPNNPQKSSDILTLKGVDEDIIHTILPPTVNQGMKKGQGLDDIIGPNLDDAKRINFEFEFEGMNAIPLTKAISHPELFKNYPQLENTYLKIDPSVPIGGSYYKTIDGDSVITMGVADQKSTVLHEIQHAVQDIEGFARGGNTSTITKADKIISPKYRKWARNKPDAERVSLLRETAEYEKELNTSNRMWRDEWEPKLDIAEEEWLRSMDEFKRGSPEAQKAKDKYMKLSDKLFSDFDKMSKAKFPIMAETDEIVKRIGGYKEPDKYLEGFPAYEKLAGEFEARNVSARREMSVDERMKSPIFSSEDIPLEDLIVRDRSAWLKQ